MSKKLNRSNIFGPFLVGIFVLIKGIVYLQHLRGREVYFTSDNAIYAALAKRFLEGDIFNAFNPYWNPGFPIATIPFYKILGSWETSQVVVSILSHLALVVVIYFSFRKISESFAVITSFLITFSPAMQKLVLFWGITEPLYVLLFWLAIYFGWLAINSKKKYHFILTGLFFGLGYFVRTEIFFTMTVFFVIAIVSPLIKVKKKYLVRTLLEIATKLFLVLAVFFLVNLPYFYVISKNLGQPTMSGKYAYFRSGPPFKLEPRLYTNYAQEVWSIDFPNYKSFFYDTEGLGNIIWKNLDNSLEATQKKFKENLSYYGHDNIFPQSTVYLAIVGFLATLFNPAFTLIAVYLFIIWIASLYYVSFFLEMSFRYLAFSYPLVLLAQAFFLYFFAKLISRNKKIILNLILVLFALIYLKDNFEIGSLTKVSKVKGSLDQKEIGEWFKSQNIKLFMGRTEAIPFYADAKMVYVPMAPPDLTVDYAKKWGVEYILARPVEVSWWFQKEIGEPTYKNKDLSLIHQFTDGSLVWKVKLTESEKKNNMRTGKVFYRGEDVY